MKKYLTLILFWGSIWGLAEATIGYLLHFLAIAVPGLPGFLMFPIAFYFMNRAYRSSGQVSAIFMVAVIAATIKLMDFLLPVYSAIRIINPSISILMEGLAVALVYQVFKTQLQNLSYLPSLYMGVVWRTLFLVYLAIISKFGLPAALVTDGMEISLRFVVVESLINSLFIYSYLRWGDLPPRWEIRPELAYGALGLALSVQLLI